MNNETSTGMLVEVFPIKEETIPKLSSYVLVTQSRGDISSIGGKLSYRLRKKYPGHWVWTGNRIVTDRPKT